MATFDNEHQASLTDFSQTHSERQRTTRGKIQTGRQRNHGTWCLPPGMDIEEGAPLWLAVALWALGQARAVTREDISQAFSVSPRRAADVLTYIISERSDLVQIYKEVVRVASGHRVARHLVKSVTLPPDTPVISSCKSKSRSKVSKAASVREQEELAQAAKLFLFQRRGSTGIP